MKLNLVVIKTEDPELLKKQYEILGLKFEFHKHGKGPFHYSAQIEGLVFEIYPLPNSVEKADSTLRLGFEIQDIEMKIRDLENENWIVKSLPKMTEWGKTAIIQDYDGRKIELKEK